MGSRLWCTIELFTYVHMGRSVDQVDFVIVQRDGREVEDMHSVVAGFEFFEAEQCTCFVAEDKERMLTIIHAAFGNITSFNLAVRNIFHAAGWKDLRHSELTVSIGCNKYHNVSTESDSDEES